MSVVQLVLGIATSHPTREAVSDASCTLTYADIASRLQHVAAGLERYGVTVGDCVGVLVSRNASLPSVLLGVQATGAAYVPLDALYPRERLRFMANDAQVRCVLADEATREEAEALGVPVVDVSALLQARQEIASHALPSLSPDSLAYVIYTSGSTGTPKGVEIPHGALATFTRAIVQRPGLSSADCVLAVTTICFDISVLELLAPLTVGARVHVAPAGLVRDGAAVARTLRPRGITVVQATPTAWQLLIASGSFSLEGVRAFCGGEPLPKELADVLLQRGAELWNLYGPTEATVWCSAARIRGHEDAITIGAPLAGYELHVIDGELCIAGALARGYRNRPELTSERFITAPIDGREQRLYRSGDLGHRRADGAFECRGRSDLQVKIDGYRIELGEIEHALAAHSSVRQAFVAVESTNTDSRTLVAYVQLTEPVSPGSLRQILAAKLPPYMMPTVYRELVEVPLTDNGKTDRKRLSTFGRPLAGETSVAPRTAAERRLLGMWHELLGRTDFGVDADYFELGGRSLTAARLFARIEQEFGRSLPIATLLHATTVAQLAQVIEASEERAWTPLVCLQPHGARTPLFLVHPSGGNVVTYRWLVDALPVNRPVFGLQAIGVNGGQPLKSIEQMADRYLEDVRRVWPMGPYLLGGASFGGLVAFEMARRLEQAGKAVPLVALFDTEYPDVPDWLPHAYVAGPAPFHPFSYPQLQRARGHLRALRERGLKGYWADVIHPSIRKAVGTSTDGDGASIGDESLPPALERVIAANHRAERHYVPLPYGGPVTLFRAGSARFSPDRRDWWRRVASVRETPVAGTHSTMRRPPHVTQLAEALRRELERADALDATRVA